MEPKFILRVTATTIEYHLRSGRQYDLGDAAAQRIRRRINSGNTIVSVVVPNPRIKVA